MLHIQPWQAMRHQVALWQGAGEAVAFVPTMGALHEGHMDVVRHAQACARHVVVSIFVNPTQFGPNEDFSSYPRTLEADIAMCRAHGVAAVYTPAMADMYPEGFATSIQVQGITSHWCGASRPGHFDGVALVVAKLLLQLMPAIACFGEKDFQQLAVIRRLVEDLHIPVAIEGVPTSREADGLARSSRNRYLSAAERQAAPALFAALNQAAASIKAGDDAKQTLANAAEALLKTGFAKVDYIGLADAQTLLPLSAYNAATPARLLAAARLGAARLIDNITL